MTVPSSTDLATDAPHRRFNPLTGDWVLVSPQRNRRPWQGKTEPTAPANRPSYDPTCYLCPGNTRAEGVHNPPYTDTFVFRNDFSALLPHSEYPSENSANGLFQSQATTGECRVMCFSLRHDLTLADMEPGDIQRVVNVWTEQIAELGQRFRWVQLFENKGEIMGCSNPHPHGQVWASDFLPTLPAREDQAQREYLARNGSPLLVDYAQEEIQKGERIVVQGEHWLGLVPYWATWPFEIMLLPSRRHIPRMTDLNETEREDLAQTIKRLLVRYDNLFDTSFPYSMGWHGAPTGPDANDADTGHWQLHAHYYPPLLRSATVKKFMVGYEMLGESQRDLTAEQAAARLRDLPDTRQHR